MPGPEGTVPGMQGMQGMPVPTMTAGGIQVVTADAIKLAQQQQAAAVAGAVQGADAAAGASAMAAAYPNLATGVRISLVRCLACSCCLLLLLLCRYGLPAQLAPVSRSAVAASGCWEGGGLRCCLRLAGGAPCMCTLPPRTLQEWQRLAFSAAHTPLCSS